MSNNFAFNKDIIQKSAELTTKNMEMVRLNNISHAMQMEGRDNAFRNQKTQSTNESVDLLEQLKQKYLNTSQDPSTRKLFVKNIGNSIKLLSRPLL